MTPISLIESLFSADVTQLPKVQFSVPGIGRIELEDEPIADKFGPQKEKKSKALRGDYRQEDIGKFYRMIESEHDVRVYEVPQSYLVRTFGYAHGNTAPIGWRTGNDIYVATHDGDKQLSYKEKKATLMHEVYAGYNHEKSDKEAQLGAIRDLSPTGRHTDIGAYEKAVEFAPRVGLYNFSLN